MKNIMVALFAVALGMGMVSCNGNTKAVAKLVAGKPVDEIVELLAGNQCRSRGTSCADQMTIALRQAQAETRARQGA